MTPFLRLYLALLAKMGSDKTNVLSALTADSSATVTAKDAAVKAEMQMAYDQMNANKADKTDPRFSDSRTPLAHVHTQADVTGLTASLVGITNSVASKADTSALTAGLAGKANSAHTHTIADVTNLQSTLDGKQVAMLKGTFSQTTLLLALNAATAFNVTLAGATVGMAAIVVPPLDIRGADIKATVISANTVEIRILASVAVAAGTRTYTVYVMQ